VYTTVYTACTRPCTGRIQAVHAVVFTCLRAMFTCSQPVYGRVTAVYTDRDQGRERAAYTCRRPCRRPCTDSVHGRVRAMYTAVYTVVLTHTRPCTRVYTGRVAVYTAVHMCILPIHNKSTCELSSLSLVSQIK